MSLRGLVNETQVIQVIIGQKTDLRFRDLQNLIDREVLKLVSRFFTYS